MLQNEPLVAKIGVDTAENEPIFGWIQLVQLSRFNSSILSLLEVGELVFAPFALTKKAIEEVFFGGAPLSAIATGTRWRVRRAVFMTAGGRLVSANSGELVFGCIEADFYNQILIFKHFSRSTRFVHLRTAPNSKSSQKIVKLFRIFC